MSVYIGTLISITPLTTKSYPIILAIFSLAYTRCASTLTQKNTVHINIFISISAEIKTVLRISQLTWFKSLPAFASELQMRDPRYIYICFEDPSLRYNIVGL